MYSDRERDIIKFYVCEMVILWEVVELRCPGWCPQPPGLKASNFCLRLTEWCIVLHFAATKLYLLVMNLIRQGTCKKNPS